MSKAKLVLYFDIVSPFAYIAFHIIRVGMPIKILAITDNQRALNPIPDNDPVFKNVDITYLPVLLGGIMQATGNTAPIKIKHKDKWIGKERLRWAHKFNVPVVASMPPGFPANTFPVQRALIAISLLQPHRFEDATAAIYEASFVHLQTVHDLQSLTPILDELLGAEITKEVVEKAKSDEVKKALSANTTQALEKGAFGLPWMECTNSEGETEGFWGVDHLGMVCDHLSLERPQERSVKGWRAML